MLNGKLLYISSSGTYYKVSVRNLSNSHDLPGTASLATYIDNQLTSISGDLNAADVSFTFNTSEIILELEQVYMECSVKINENNVLSRCHLVDSPYDMFCIPYSDELQLKYGTTTFTCNKSAAIAIAVGISEQLGSGSIYDLQLLPYCPNRSLATSLVSGVVAIDDLKYDLILNSNNNAISAVIWCDKSNFQFEINQTLTSSQIEAMDSLNLKLENECKLYRLCAGNHSAMFEFSLAKSNGISGFLVDCTYKPFNPYIHVIPKLKGLYGENFTNIDDARGLIYGGDLSLPQITSAWADYQLQNKNYQLMFDRQIANIDVNNGIAQEKQNFQNVLGVLGGGVGGAAAGAKAGPYGAIAGAIAGTATAGIGAALQSDWLTRQQEENRSFTIDMYKYNLGNIQALPYALAKTSALTANTRI